MILYSPEFCEQSQPHPQSPETPPSREQSNPRNGPQSSISTVQYKGSGETSPHKSLGRAPEKLLFRRSMVFRVEFVASRASPKGMLPVKWLSFNSKRLTLPHRAISLGSDPVNRLPKTRRSSKALENIHSAGIVPDNWFSCRNSPYISVIAPSSEGNAPVSWFPWSLKNWTELRRPNCVGMDPVS